MKHDHLPESALHDLVDGELSAAEAEAARAHLAGCPACADARDRLMALRASLASLPERLDPGADLRPEIRAEVAHRSAVRSRRAALREAWRPLTAAAAVLVVVTASVTAVLVGPDGPEPEAPGEAVGAASFETVLAEYTRAAADLRHALDAEGDRLSPATARLVRADLAAVERALAESRAALEADPSSAVARELVLAAHRQRLNVLRRAASLVAES